MFRPKIPEKVELSVKAKWDGDMGGVVKINESEIRFDIPEEYGGPGRYACPGEVFLAAIGACIINTYLYFAEEKRGNIRDLGVGVSSSIKLTSNGYNFEHVDITIMLKVRDGWEDEAFKLLDMSIKYCYITKLIRKSVPINIYTYINEQGPIKWTLGA